MNRREFLKTISAAALAVSVPVPLVMGQSAEAGLVMGIDAARFRDCYRAPLILLRQGRKLVDLQAFDALNLLEWADRVGVLIKKWHPDAVLVNSVGDGAGLIDALRDRGYSVTEVNAATKEWGDLSRAWLDRTLVTPHPIQGDCLLEKTHSAPPEFQGATI